MEKAWKGRGAAHAGRGSAWACSVCVANGQEALARAYARASLESPADAYRAG